MNVGRDPGHDARRHAATIGGHHNTRYAGDPRGGESQYVEDVFWYDLFFTSIANLAPGASNVQTLQIASDEPFKCTKLTGFANVFGVAPIVRNAAELTVIIQDGSNGRFLTQSPVAWDTIIGTAQLPYILPIPRFFKSRGLITVTVANTSTAGGTNNTYANISITFGGTKLFEDDGSNHDPRHGSHHRR